MQRKVRALVAVILSIFMTSESWSIGGANIGNEVPSARAAGQGYTGVAGQNNDPTAVYTNPGAITSLDGTQMTVGLHWENIHGSYESDAGAETKAKTTNVAVPNFSLTQSFLDGKLGAGLSVQSPFGLETHWGGDSPLRYVATDSRLGMVEIMPAVAYEITPMLSVGAGLKYVNLFTAQLDRKINTDAVNTALGAPTAGSVDTNSSLQGQAADWGYHVGLVLKPHEKHAIGVTYHSKINLRVNGNVTLRNLSGASAALFGGTDYTTSAYTDLVLPQNVQIGYAFKPSEKWMFEADTAWFHWSESKDLNVRFAETNAFRQAILNTGNPAKFDNRDAWSFATGVNYKATDRWQLRTGFWYEPWALPETNFNPAFSDLSRYGASLGTGFSITKDLTLDAAYTAVFFHNRHIHNDVGTTTSGVPPVLVGLGYNDPDIDGTYKDFANLVALNLTYRFGGK
jgi:long-chain fatty acid transport protein